ncbi:OLC1v1012368C1 [Oldenlandia corymbosa var. corymbosa]|uniref:OLC1v1012368C1 n=1 Tax=Oldenlandia corymbosa var. corymbosa TaxID=529605 RepID=A0AAV1DVU3_OLDCO|nr:OLC1v1012368C1 [Oldenlandia corymbosa var. corymbosa]
MGDSGGFGELLEISYFKDQPVPASENYGRQLCLELKNKPCTLVICEAEPEERRMPDLSDWVSSTASSADYQVICLSNSLRVLSIPPSVFPAHLSILVGVFKLVYDQTANMAVVGSLFNPTAEQLVSYYLRKMILGQTLMKEERFFAVKDLYRDDDLPWQIVKSQKTLVAGCGACHVHSSAKPVMTNNGSGRKIGQRKTFTLQSPAQSVGQWTITEYSIDAAAHGIPEVEGINYSDYILWDSDMVAAAKEQSFGKKMKVVSSCEDLSVVTCFDEEEGSDNVVPFLINEVAAAASPSTCWNVPVDESFLDDPNFLDFDINSFLNHMVVYN